MTSRPAWRVGKRGHAGLTQAERRLPMVVVHSLIFHFNQVKALAALLTLWAWLSHRNK